MKEYDMIVIGAGSGLTLAYKAVAEKMKVALVAKEHLGGTCMNVGCVPSKTLLHVADTVLQIREAGKLGIDAEIKSIDFPAIMARVRGSISRGVEFTRNDLKGSEYLDLYEDEGQFVDKLTVEVAGERIRGQKVFIASGARPAIPPIKGLADIRYLTNESLLRLEKLPESVIVVGGSYVGVEYAHFLSGLGSAVSVVEYGDRLVPFEEPEISSLLEKTLLTRMEIHTNHEAMAVVEEGGFAVLTARDRKSGQEKRLRGQEILIAAGRKSNADRLKVERTGVDLTGNGYIAVDDYLQTTQPGIWALGDATGKGMFTHAADREVRLAWHNAFHDDKIRMAFNEVPHAVFTSPQIASVGMTEEQARNRGHDILVGKAKYEDIVQGDVRLESEGFAKAIVEKGTERILGFHIIGPEASTLIQEVINVVVQKGSYKSVTEPMHIFPALSELVQETLHRLEG
jgi:mycothione reductase